MWISQDMKAINTLAANMEIIWQTTISIGYHYISIFVLYLKAMSGLYSVFISTYKFKNIDVCFFYLDDIQRTNHLVKNHFLEL